jgi:hypothetical protein
MTSYVSAELRRTVERRAKRVCEYCQIHQDDTLLGCQVDHVISEKHGGATESDNLSYACTFCNRYKGPDVGSIAASTGEFTRLFNPRTDCWSEHFTLNGVIIEPQTAIGEVTVRLLRFNDPERLIERELLERVGRYPASRTSEDSA